MPDALLLVVSNLIVVAVEPESKDFSHFVLFYFIPFFRFCDVFCYINGQFYIHDHLLISGGIWLGVYKEAL